MQRGGGARQVKGKREDSRETSSKGKGLDKHRAGRKRREGYRSNGRIRD